ncbi:TIGR01777 family oxidoreductase [candidate division KSB1 bacterium]
MNTLIAGATGTIGRTLCPYLLNNDFRIFVLTRNKVYAESTLDKDIKIIEWTLNSNDDWWKECGEIDVVINLAGASIGEKRWTKKQKDIILSSRINATRILVSAIKEKRINPSLFINSSAIGYYGYDNNNPDYLFNEQDGPGTGFLSEVCEKWENEALKADTSFSRIVIHRFGVVLSSNGGTLQKMIPPVKYYAGGIFGSGDQWMSWIHIEDLHEIIRFTIENHNISGTYNAVSPNPTNNKIFVNTLGEILKRPVYFRIPRYLMELALGNMAELIFESQKVEPKRLLEAGFRFKFPDLKEALKSLL